MEEVVRKLLLCRLLHYCPTTFESEHVENKHVVRLVCPEGEVHSTATYSRAALLYILYLPKALICNAAPDYCFMQSKVGSHESARPLVITENIQVNNKQNFADN